MMFGRRDVFGYTACPACASVQIDQVPDDLGAYYPPDYYSMGTHREKMQASAAARVKRVLKWLRFRAAHGRPLPVQRALRRVWGEPDFAPWVRLADVRLGSAILDVGSGSGYLLQQLHLVGFTDLAGADPFLEADGEAAPGVPLWRRELAEVEGHFDVICFNHSLEHVPDPAAALRAAADRLRPGGRIVVRLPVADSYAHRTYGADWVQLDAPRHLAIPSHRGMEALAGRLGLAVTGVLYESRSFQFWGSEQYRRGIPLTDGRSYSANPDRSPFTSEDIARFSRHAEQLNADHDGDEACFILQRAQPSSSS